MQKKIWFLGILWALCLSLSYAQESLDYQVPPTEIRSLVEFTPTPRVILDKQGKTMLLLQTSSYPSLAELAEPELRIAGLRFNPQNNGQTRLNYVKKLSLQDVATGKERVVEGLPAMPLLTNFSWSPDEQRVAFSHTEPNKITLYVLDIKTATAKPITTLPLNAVLANLPFAWLPDSQEILFLSPTTERGTPPSTEALPTGPAIQENLGKQAPARTYQDLLKNPNDEKIFEYYAQADLYRIDIATQKTQKLASSLLIQGFSPSPDGKYILLQSYQRPYSYVLPLNFFPIKVQIIATQTGNIVKEVVQLPLADNIPIGFDAVRQGQRSHSWRADMPATLFWIEAQDEGNPKKEVPIRDKAFVWNTPFDSAPTNLFSTKLRFGGVVWGDAQNALIRERWWANRKEIRTLLNPTTQAANILFERSYEDTYSDPGEPELTKNQFGRAVLDLQENKLWFLGQGASPEGERPFLDEMDLKTRKIQRLWRSEAPYYERVVQTIDRKKQVLIVIRESPTENPNYYIRDLKRKSLKAITQFAHPYPQLKDVKKEILRYKRADGVELTAILHLPPNYQKGQGVLPTLLEAYPREFKSKSAAGQVNESPYQFTAINWGSPVFWALRGYAVLENATIPIVGEGKQEPNDTYITQLVAGAKAAIDEGVRLGVVDDKRVGVMGHSYGAFMTANFLTHSNLFKAGIARSGAYNRTLTPFGFQSEERTFWQAPEVYNQMSPFNYADKIKTPILLIHGEADNNQGTFPIQSERYYNAIKGHGGIARYVVLPFESHGYRAKESILHMLWEMDTWLEKYVKNAK